MQTAPTGKPEQHHWLNREAAGLAAAPAVLAIAAICGKAEKGEPTAA